MINKGVRKKLYPKLSRGGEIMKFVVRRVKTTKFACHVDQNC